MTWNRDASKGDNHESSLACDSVTPLGSSALLLTWLAKLAGLSETKGITQRVLSHFMHVKTFAFESR